MTKSEDNIFDEIFELQMEIQDLIRALILLDWDSDGGKMKIESLIRDIERLETEL